MDDVLPLKDVVVSSGSYARKPSVYKVNDSWPSVLDPKNPSLTLSLSQYQAIRFVLIREFATIAGLRRPNLTDKHV
jgi:hypothetical protein